LAKWQKVKIFQNEKLSKIYVSVIDDLSSFDVNQANGFEDEQESRQEEENKFVEQAIEHSMHQDMSSAEQPTLQ
jgi:hypothetical protein